MGEVLAGGFVAATPDDVGAAVALPGDRVARVVDGAPYIAVARPAALGVVRRAEVPLLKRSRGFDRTLESREQRSLERKQQVTKLFWSQAFFSSDLYSRGLLREFAF